MNSKIILVLLLFATSFTSCRTEETEFIQAPEDETLVANSSIALLMQRTSSKDGSFDNIVDKANCFTVKFPYEIRVNNQDLSLSSSADFTLVECVFDASEDDIDTLEIQFPIEIILADFSEITINTPTEYNSYVSDCNGENVADSDIECIDFQFPIEASIFNINNEFLETVNLETDAQLYKFIETITEDDVITMDFPITVNLADSTEVSVTNFNELQTVIENAINTCDEDDDYNYNEDDCDDCTKIEIENLLTNCTDWSVNTLRRESNTNYDDIYYNYAFNFFTDGTLSVFWNTTTVYGTWEVSGSGNNTEVEIDIPSLPLCNNNWILREVKNCSDETEIDLRLGTDRLQYARNCN
ncbi:MAG: hypothetical protein NWP87_00135 [Winogradskyella sp.]|nr:hypothetical protein [Winogradskyella sp.]